jgi:hypothetical protein
MELIKYGVPRNMKIQKGYIKVCLALYGFKLGLGEKVLNN